MRLKLSSYWAYQIFGWGLFALINISFALAFNKFDLNFIKRLLIFVALGVSFSHLMRLTIIRGNLFHQSLQRQVIGSILITLIFAFVVGSLEYAATRAFAIGIWQQQTFSEWKQIIGNTFASFVYLFVWNCIYFCYHYVQKSRNQQLETLKLEALVKELEEKALRAN